MVTKDQIPVYGRDGDGQGVFSGGEQGRQRRRPRRANAIEQADARLIMIFDGRWKYVRFEKMRRQLYDLAADPIELNELGSDPQ